MCIVNKKITHFNNYYDTSKYFEKITTFEYYHKTPFK